MDTEPSARVSPEQPLTEYSALEVKSHTASSLGYEDTSAYIWSRFWVQPIS